MWLTGFDVPSLATCMFTSLCPTQSYAGNRPCKCVFRDKEGLVVDYVGIATALKQAMNDYTPVIRRTTAILMLLGLLIRSSWKSYLFAVINSTDMIIPNSKTAQTLKEQRLSAVLSTSSWAGKVDEKTLL